MNPISFLENSDSSSIDGMSVALTRTDTRDQPINPLNLCSIHSCPLGFDQDSIASKCDQDKNEA